MQIKAKKTETREYEYTESVVCDLCGDKVQGIDGWKADHRDALDIQVRMRTGENWPDGGSGEDISYDICPKCFKEKLIPFLESQGAKTMVESWDW